jgi:hypothetical protein
MLVAIDTTLLLERFQLKDDFRSLRQLLAKLADLPVLMEDKK